MQVYSLAVRGTFRKLQPSAQSVFRASYSSLQTFALSVQPQIERQSVVCLYQPVHPDLGLDEILSAGVPRSPVLDESEPQCLTRPRA